MQWQSQEVGSKPLEVVSSHLHSTNKNSATENENQSSKSWDKKRRRQNELTWIVSVWIFSLSKRRTQQMNQVSGQYLAKENNETNRKINWIRISLCPMKSRRSIFELSAHCYFAKEITLTQPFNKFTNRFNFAPGCEKEAKWIECFS